MSVTLYGIPSCGTVKKARKWLNANGIAYTWVDFRSTAPEPERVAGWMAKFGSKPMRNTSGGAYRAQPAQKKGWGDVEWLPLMQTDPMLLKRPVVEIDGEPAAVGFKEPVYAELFGV
jgi:arsenate reductase (glutaredoxin)